MDKFFNVALIVAPILFAAALGILARKRAMLTAAQVQGLQQFVIKFGLPCTLFNSCLNAEITAQSISTMAIIVLFALIAALWAFRTRRRGCPYHNLPLLFCAKETGMLGIPLCILLFGSAQSYRMGVLDLAQGLIAIPVLSILSSNAGENLSVKKIIKQVFTSPLLICSLLGLLLNLTGLRDILNTVGIGPIITESTAFLGQPISALMLFSVGYNFSFSVKDRRTIFKFTAMHFGMHMVFCLLAQLILCLIPNVDPMTRWVILLYYALPGSLLTPSLGRTEDDYTLASGVCSLLTLLCLIIFCIMAVFVV